MASGYEKYLIADFGLGVTEDKEPWLIPSKAFTVLENGYVYKGVINKRKGYEEFARFVHNVEESTWTGDGSTTTYSGTFTNTPIRVGDVTITYTCASGTDILKDTTTSGVFEGTITTSSGVIDYETGTYSVSLEQATTSGTTASGSYNYFPGNPIVGIWNFYTNTGSEDLLVMDTKRINKYSPVTNLLYDFSNGSDIWTGTEERYVFTADYNNKFFMTNYKDRLKYWYNNSVNDLDVNFTVVTGTNELNTCLMCFDYKERLVLLHTNESVDGLCPQRARWCTIADETDWTNDGYVDAPTSEWIQSAEFLGEDLIVFFDRSVWALEYTSDSTLPFVWRKIVDGEGSYATFSTSVFSNDIITRGPTNMISCNGTNDAKPIDNDILDFVLKTNQEKVDWTYNGHLDEIKQDWWTYVSLGSEHCDKILVYNYYDNAWSNYTIPLTSIGFYEVESDITWDDIPGIMDDCEIVFDDREIMAGFPTTIGGSRDGYIYTMNTGGTDNGSDIYFELKTKRFNPYADHGKSCRLGYVEFLVTVDAEISLSVDFMKNNSNTAYLTKTLTFDSDEDQEKVWKKIHCNTVGWNHQLKLYHTESNQTLKIHAIRLAMKPVGRGR